MIVLILLLILGLSLFCVQALLPYPLNYGVGSVFHEGTTDYISIANFNSTHFVIAYRDTTTNYGYVRVGMNDVPITWITGETFFNQASTYLTSVAILGMMLIMMVSITTLMFHRWCHTTEKHVHQDNQEAKGNIDGILMEMAS